MSTRRVSYEQLETMWEFLNSHRDVAMGYNKSAQARAMSRRMWTELTETLNSIAGGATKDWKNWSNYWVDYKGKLKRKCASIRVSHSRTGGGPSQAPALTDIEQKFLSILGEDLGSGLPGIQVAVDTGSTHAPSPSHESENLNVLDIEFEAIVENNPNPASNTEETANPLEVSITHQQSSTQRTQPAEPAQPASIQSRRRQRRPTPMSQETARRALVESSRLRAEAEQEKACSMRNLENYLLRIADTLDSIQNSLACLPTNEQ